MELYPINTPEEKERHIAWLNNLREHLQNKPESGANYVFEKDGDVADAKKLVGTFIATLTGEKVVID